MLEIERDLGVVRKLNRLTLITSGKHNIQGHANQLSKHSVLSLL